jgi:methionyl-tRNA formyltransferase
MKKYSLVFAGTPDFACPALKALIQDERFDVKAVISQSDKPVGRKQILQPTPVKKVALENNILLFQPQKIQEIEKEIKALKPDFFIVIAYGQIFPKSILQIAKWNINFHASVLPKYRGASPIQEALKNGDAQTGITIMNIEEKMDSGGVYKIHSLPILQKDNAQTLYNKIANLGKLLPDDLIEIANGLKLTPQNEANASYCKKITKQDGEIHWDKQIAKEIFNKMRAFTPWPGIFFIHKGKRVKIISGLVVKEHCPEFKIGDFDLEKGVKTKKGFFLPLRVLPEGKKEQSYKEWRKNSF